MDKIESWEKLSIERYQALLLVNGAAVLLIGLFAGIILIFSMVDGIVVWPFLNIDVDIPGTVRGWKAAHVGGLENGLLLILMGIVLTKVVISYASARIVFWFFVLTGWGNTVFYWAANLSANRGVSFGDNQYGESDLAGIIAYFSGGSVMLLTIAGTFIIFKAALRKVDQTA